MQRFDLLFKKSGMVKTDGQPSAFYNASDTMTVSENTTPGIPRTPLRKLKSNHVIIHE